MMYYLVAAFFVPIAIVILLLALNHWLKGMKTYILGTVITVMGALHTMDLNFLPSDVVSSLLAGSGIAVVIVSKATDRK